MKKTIRCALLIDIEVESETDFTDDALIEGIMTEVAGELQIEGNFDCELYDEAADEGVAVTIGAVWVFAPLAEPTPRVLSEDGQ